ncbi:MAG: phosphodiester glycosidase family protein [Halanaerobiales bacterium]
MKRLFFLSLIILFLPIYTVIIVKAEEIQINSQLVSVDEREIEITILTIPTDIDFATDIGLGDKIVGGTEALSDMAKRRTARLAINGTFFNPEDYNNNTPTEPYGTLIREGRVLHVGNYGATVGFDRNGNVFIEQLRIKIEGGSDGSYTWPNNWYAYGFNHTPSGPDSSSVYIYTPERGEKVGFNYGTKVVVSNGKVAGIVRNQDTIIPRDGFVIVMTGAERQLESVFTVGKTVEYRIRYEDVDQNDISFDYYTAVGAGPMLVDNGRVLTNYREQGFTSNKILSAGGRRTALGVKNDGTMMIVLANRVTVEEMANIMKQLDAVEAMNLDGGASSGAWFDGKYIVDPGRKLSNALLFFE